MEHQELNLDTIGGGAAKELFDEALSSVLENISDINTDHKVPREITLRFRITADEERRAGSVVISCNKKLAGFSGRKIDIYFGRQHGRFTAVAAPTQADMFPTPESRPRAVPAAEEAAS